MVPRTISSPGKQTFGPIVRLALDLGEQDIDGMIDDAGDGLVGRW